MHSYLSDLYTAAAYVSGNDSGDSSPDYVKDIFRKYLASLDGDGLMDITAFACLVIISVRKMFGRDRHKVWEAIEDVLKQEPKGQCREGHPEGGEKPGTEGRKLIAGMESLAGRYCMTHDLNTLKDFENIYNKYLGLVSDAGMIDTDAAACLASVLKESHDGTKNIPDDVFDEVAGFELSLFGTASDVMPGFFHKYSYGKAKIKPLDLSDWMRCSLTGLEDMLADSRSLKRGLLVGNRLSKAVAYMKKSDYCDMHAEEMEELFAVLDYSERHLLSGLYGWLSKSCSGSGNTHRITDGRTDRSDQLEYVVMKECADNASEHTGIILGCSIERLKELDGCGSDFGRHADMFGEIRSGFRMLPETLVTKPDELFSLIYKNRKENFWAVAYRAITFIKCSLLDRTDDRVTGILSGILKQNGLPETIDDSEAYEYFLDPSDYTGRMWRMDRITGRAYILNNDFNPSVRQQRRYVWMPCTRKLNEERDYYMSISRSNAILQFIARMRDWEKVGIGELFEVGDATGDDRLTGEEFAREMAYIDAQYTEGCIRSED